MKLAHKPEDISALLQRVKEKGGSLTTNLFIDAEKLDDWINNGLLYFNETEYGALFLRKDWSFYHLYYYTNSLADLQILVNNHLPQKKLVLDIIGKSKNLNDLENLFVKANFKKHTQLERYTRINQSDSTFYFLSDEVSLAEKEDADAIARMFEENFDKFSEQVPQLNEVKKLIDEKKILIVKENDNIKGFLVRTFNGQSSILNNFLVDKRFRGEKIGSKLLKYYISESKAVKRMMLWVVFDNETAINVYQHHGYIKDDLVDTILVKNNDE